ncbi:hypothetical protein BVY01_00215 [bacterium I07]|nr:hypothetical protein BVY01_00215 [bacterium I07]
MNTKKHTKFIHEGQYVAEVDIELIDSEEGWAPYLSLDDAKRLDQIRIALRRGDLKFASKHAKVYSLTPVLIDS